MASLYLSADFVVMTPRAFVQRLARFLILAALLLTPLLTQHAHAQGVLADKPDVQAALNRFTGGHSYASEAERARDQATLFANNDAINKARLNNEIPDGAYQAAQTDYADLNRSFAEAAATDAGAKFTVQKSSSPDSFSPGTDSDYITEVTSKEQIPKMQQGYNDRVNQFLEQNGVSEQRGNWHNKLDTDFMADPTHITDPDEFLAVAEYNNDAYKRRMAAEYERISRAGDGTKIGPEHVEGYMDEMNDFINKKRGKIDEMLAKGPAHFSDSANRAELFQAMAQEQKYTSRLESLDDFLRAQEGLPPRNRGLTAAKLGSNRAPGNAGNIRAGRTVGEASRLSAMEDLAETMGQVSKNNPNFNPNMADDIAKIVEGLPPERRAGVLARIKGNGNPGLVDDILDASRRAGRLPPGATLADDVARAGSKFDEMTDAFSKVDDLADAGTGRGALGRAIGALEAIGKAADTLEGAVAAGRLASLFSQMHRASDPELSPEERNDLLEKIRQAANDLRDSAALGAIMQRYPLIAAIYGVWTVGCLAGEARSASTEASGGCLDRQISAMDRAAEDLQSWWSGTPRPREGNNQAICNKLRQAVAERRVRPRGLFTEDDLCWALQRGEKISDMIEPLPPEGERDQEPAEPEIVLTPASCDPSINMATIAGLREAAGTGSGEAIAHISRLEAVNGRIATAESAFDRARRAYGSGDMGATRSGLDTARAAIDGLGGEPNCAALAGRIAEAQGKTERMERILSRARDAVETCEPGLLAVVKDEYRDLTLSPMRSLLAQADAAIAANASYEDARNQFIRGNLAIAEKGVREAQQRLSAVGEGACSNLRERLDNALGKIDRLREAISSAEQAVAGCDLSAVSRWQSGLAQVTNPAAAAVRRQLDKAEEACQQRERETANTGCRSENGPGYRAGAPSGNGGFYCVPDQQAADARCRNAYDATYFAANIKENGSFDCRQDEAAGRTERITNARKACKKSFGRYAIADPKTAATDDPRCICSKGYRWNDRQTACVPIRQPAEASTTPQPQPGTSAIPVSGRWSVVAFQHSDGRWGKPKPGLLWIDVQADASGSAGRVTSYQQGGGKSVSGVWRQVAADVMHVDWSDGDKQRYRIISVSSTRARLVRISNGFHIVLQR